MNVITYPSGITVNEQKGRRVINKYDVDIKRKVGAWLSISWIVSIFSPVGVGKR